MKVHTLTYELTQLHNQVMAARSRWLPQKAHARARVLYVLMWQYSDNTGIPALNYTHCDSVYRYR